MMILESRLKRLFPILQISLSCHWRGILLAKTNISAWDWVMEMV